MSFMSITYMTTFITLKYANEKKTSFVSSEQHTMISRSHKAEDVLKIFQGKRKERYNKNGKRVQKRRDRLIVEKKAGILLKFYIIYWRNENEISLTFFFK